MRDILPFRGPDPVAQKRENNCVPTVLAMIFDASVETVEEALGTSGPIRVRELSRFLAELGGHPRTVQGELAAEYWSIFQRNYGSSKLRALGAFRPAGEEKSLHAVLVTAGSIYDPQIQERRPTNRSNLAELDFLMLMRPRFFQQVDLSEHTSTDTEDDSSESSDETNGVEAHWRSRVMEEITNGADRRLGS